MINKKFAHLHVHNEYSLLDGFGTAEQWAKEAKRLGFEYLALTNHGNIDGLIKFQKACQKEGIKHIFGCEMYIVPDASIKVKGDRRGHISLFVKNKKGWRNLLRLMTFACLDGFYSKPRIDYPHLLKWCEGLVVGTGCAGSFLLQHGGVNFMLDLEEKIPGDVYLEIMPHQLDVQYKINELCLDINKEMPHIKLLATNDAHYILEEDARRQEVLLAIGTKDKWSNEKRFRFTIEDFFMRTANQMIQAFINQKQVKKKQYMDAMRNTLEVAEKCSRYSLKQRNISLPAVSGLPAEKSDKAILRKLCRQGLKRIGKSKDKVYLARFKEEFKLITDKKFERYFLIVWELINWCHENGIMTGPGRGSVGGSLIAYLLGITGVDPIEYNLLFARFISKERIDYPDIDIDFEDRKRHEVRAHLQEMYGENNVAGVSTFMKMKGRGILRDVSRVFEVPYKEVDEAAKAIPDDPDSKNRDDLVAESVKNEIEVRRFAKKYPEVVDLAIKMEGQIKAAGQHAAAVIVSKEDLTKGFRTNLMHRNKTLVCNWEKDDCEFMGLMKLDILGLNTLSILNEARRLIEKNTGKPFVFEDIPFDDKKTLKAFANGENVGSFQFNSYGMIKLCKEMKIDSFNLLVAANALFRPGPLRSGMVDQFIKNRKAGKWKSIHPIMEELTRDTYGIIVYQEQVMFIANKLAGMDWSRADKIRKVIGKSKGKDELNKFKKEFVDGCIATNDVKQKVASKLWDEIVEFAGYGFNKSHAVEYSMLGYWCQYLRIHYGPEFISGSLTYGREEQKRPLCEFAYSIGLKIMPPKIGISEGLRWYGEGKKLYTPFIEIKGIGEKTAMKIERGEVGKVSTKGFFGLKKQSMAVNESSTTQVLNAVGAYDKDSIPKTAQAFLPNFDLRGVDK